MRSYQCYAMSADGHLQTRSDFLADSDAQALLRARSLYIDQREVFGFELWAGAQLVRQELLRDRSAHRELTLETPHVRTGEPRWES